MFGKKKAEPKRKGGGEALMAQMGIFSDMSQMEAEVYGNVEEDEELEAELLALQGQSSPKKSAKKDIRTPAGGLDQMIAESMKDIPSDEEMSDTEDPDMMAELLALQDEDETPAQVETPSSHSSPEDSAGLAALLQERLNMYQQAHSQAKTAGEGSKVRRLDRGIKTLHDQLKQTQSGKLVAEDDIPPPVSVSAIKPTTSNTPPTHSPTDQSGLLTRESSESKALTQPSKPAPYLTPTTAPIAAVGEKSTARDITQTQLTSKQIPETSRRVGDQNKSGSTAAKSEVPSSSSPAQQSQAESDVHTMLVTRRNQYKMAALRAKQSGFGDMAMKYIKIAKQFDRVIEALEKGQPIDLEKMPPPPPGYTETPLATESRQLSSNNNKPDASGTTDIAVEETEPPELTPEDKANLFKAPGTATSIGEALQQRLDKYRSAMDEAKQEGNSSKARRMGRIVKQYEGAVKAHRAGKPVDYEELPTPPGFPPIPTATKSPSSAQVDPPPTSSAVPSSTTPLRPGASSPTQVKPATQTPPKALNRQTSLLSRSEQQAMFLEERQLQFKKAALEAKKAGDVELAKKYLKMALGFNQMIEAARSGLPVNLSEVPSPPGAHEDFEFVEASDVSSGDRDDAYKKLEQELIEQIRTCSKNAEHFKRLGDVSSASKFDKLGANARKDLDAVKNAYKHGDPVPRFHYESRTFSLVQTCTDLGDNDLELVLVRGINYHLPSDYSPKDLDTYVKYEFPYPNDAMQKGTSETFKGSNSPEYNQSFSLQVSRKSRAFLRLLKNKAMKFEIFYKRGFFKGDKLLGTVNVKLHALENICILHDSFDLMDGRKSLGGKLEVKLRVRDPFSNKQVEEVKEKWLVIDNFDRVLDPKPQSSSMTKSISLSSMEVLKYEKQLLDQKISELCDKTTPKDLETLQALSDGISQKIEAEKLLLKTGGLEAWKGYIKKIEASKAEYLQEAQKQVQKGNREKAQIALNKKKLIEKEVDSIQAKLKI